MLKKKQSKNLVFIILKTLSFMVGMDIFLTSIFIIFKGEFIRNSLESETSIKIKKLEYNQNI